MKPLVYYARWQGAKLRLRGRDKTAVWGHLVFTNEDGTDQQKAFRYLLATQQITLDDDEGEQELQLDEMGVVQ